MLTKEQFAKCSEIFEQLNDLTEAIDELARAFRHGTTFSIRIDGVREDADGCYAVPSVRLRGDSTLLGAIIDGCSVQVNECKDRLARLGVVVE